MARLIVKYHLLNIMEFGQSEGQLWCIWQTRGDERKHLQKCHVASKTQLGRLIGFNPTPSIKFSVNNIGIKLYFTSILTRSRLPRVINLNLIEV